MAEGTYTVTVEIQYHGDNDLDAAAQLQATLAIANAVMKNLIQIPPVLSYDQPTHGDPTFEAD